MTSVTPEMLRKILRYEPETGDLIWRERGPEFFGGSQKKANQWNGRNAGRVAGVISEGYRVLTVFGKARRAHRLAWAIHTGEHPKGHIDHINHDKSDNRLCNLRDVAPMENKRNLPLNKKGALGVVWVTDRDKWRAQIKVNGKSHYLGYFADFDDALMARRAAEADFGFHPNHGA